MNTDRLDDHPEDSAEEILKKLDEENEAKIAALQWELKQDKLREEEAFHAQMRRHKKSRQKEKSARQARKKNRR